jgi:hypothetical protein
MMRTLKPALAFTLITAGLPWAVSQSVVPDPPAKRLPRGCAYFYQTPILLKVPSEFAGSAEGAVTRSSAQLSFKRRSAKDYFFTATQDGETSARGVLWPPFRLAEDTSPWTIMCGLHGLHDGENTK